MSARVQETKRPQADARLWVGLAVALLLWVALYRVNGPFWNSEGRNARTATLRDRRSRQLSGQWRGRNK